MPDLHRRLRDDLAAALRTRDRDSIRVLRTVLSALANAQAQPPLPETPTSQRAPSPIAGAVDGLAATEVDRRELDEQQVRAIVAAERDERLAAAEDLLSRGALDAGQALRGEAALLQRYLS